MATKRVLAAVRAIPLAGAAILVGQILYAGHRSDLPSFGNQDPSGTFGSTRLPRLRIVVLGDSSVTGPGVEPFDALWARRLGMHLSDRYHVELHAVAVGGSKARDVVAGQLPAALDLRPDLAIVSVGANDALRATRIGRFEREMHTIVGTLHAEVDAVAVSGIGDLGGIPRLPALPRALARARARAFDAAIERVAASYPRAEKSVTWGPMWEPFSTPDPEVYAGDLFHASGKGHEIFAAAAITVVERLLPLVGAQADAR